MGKVISAVGSLVGLGGGGAPKVNSTAATDETATAEAAAKKARSALLETAGGQAGQQLAPGQVSAGRDTLLGN